MVMQNKESGFLKSTDVPLERRGKDDRFGFVVRQAHLHGDFVHVISNTLAVASGIPGSRRSIRETSFSSKRRLHLSAVHSIIIRT